MKIIFRSVCVLLIFSLNVSLPSLAQTGNNPAAAAKPVSVENSPEVTLATRYATELRDLFNRGRGKRISDNPRNSGNSTAAKTLDSAIRYSNQAMALADSVADRKTLGQLYRERSHIEGIRGRYDSAHEYWVNAWNINDSVNSQQKKNELSELKGKQDLETRNKEIALHQLQAAVQRRAVAGLAAGAVLLIVVGALLFLQNRRRKKNNRTLLVLNTQLKEANRVKARFFGILSHDLRSPIANLLGFLHLVKTEPGMLTASEQAGHHKDISRSAEDLLETMETMLLWSKEQMDSFRPDLKQVPVQELFDYLRKFFGREKESVLFFSNPESLAVTADENYLRTIMQNLSSNALKALINDPVGRVEWKAVKSGGETILTVTDNGPGLKKEQSQALFTGSTAVNAGTGFGFHLIRDLAVAIQYSISVESEPGKGTTFTLQPAKIASSKSSLVSA